MSTRIEREYKAMLAPDRLAFVRNREGGVCQVRILRETADRYVVGYPDPTKTGRAIQPLMKSEWHIVPSKADLCYVYLACGAFVGLIIGGIYLYLTK